MSIPTQTVYFIDPLSRLRSPYRPLPPISPAFVFYMQYVQQRHSIPVWSDNLGCLIGRNSLTVCLYLVCHFKVIKIPIPELMWRRNNEPSFGELHARYAHEAQGDAVQAGHIFETVQCETTRSK